MNFYLDFLKTFFYDMVKNNYKYFTAFRVLLANKSHLSKESLFTASILLLHNFYNSLWDAERQLLGQILDEPILPYQCLKQISLWASACPPAFWGLTTDLIKIWKVFWPWMQNGATWLSPLRCDKVLHHAGKCTDCHQITAGWLVEDCL